MLEGNLRSAVTDNQTFLRIPSTVMVFFCRLAYLRVLVIPVVFLPTPPSALALPRRDTELITEVLLPVTKHFFVMFISPLALELTRVVVDLELATLTV